MKLSKAFFKTIFILQFFSILFISNQSAAYPNPERKSMTLRKADPELCVAIRGNGELIMAHMNSVSRVLGHFGFFDGIAGGSSGSVTSFLYESALQNPALWDCPSCTQQDFAFRAALMMKSLWAYVDIVKKSDDFAAVFDLASSVNKIAEDLKKKGITADKIHTLNPTQMLELSSNILKLLNSSDIKNLLNPEIISFLKNPANIELFKFRLKEVLASIETFGSFDASDRRIFFRPGIISFPSVVSRFARIANFLAGRGGSHYYDHSGMKEFLDQCSTKAVGLQWKELVALDKNCDAKIKSLMITYRNKAIAKEIDVDSRLNDFVGQYTHTLISSGLLEENESKEFLKGFSLYKDNNGFENFKFDIFNKIKFAYWGHDADLNKLNQNINKFDDLKTQKSHSLYNARWKTALLASISEPGLSRFLELPNTNMVTAAGWTDLAPVLVLKNIGCKKVFYITRQGADSPFGRGIAANLGMTKEEDFKLYELSNPQSSLSRFLKEANAVWCTNWNAHPVATDIQGLDDDSYHAPLIAPKPLFVEAYPRYKKQSPIGPEGCF